MAPKTGSAIRAAIYTRVSTDDQAEKGYSLPSQLEACRKYAAQHELTVVAEFSDDYTGSKLDRPGMDQLRAAIRDGDVDAVIAFSSDRWTRSLAHALILREELQSHGIELHYVRRGKSEDTPEARMMDNIEGVFNEYWREKIIESSRRGRIGKAKSGKVISRYCAPFGYHFNDGQLEVVEEEAQVIRKIFTWYARGDETGKRHSDRSIAVKLSRLGVATPGERKGRRRTRAPRMWCVCAIARILTSDAYIGTWRYGKTIMVGGKRQDRPVDQQIPISVPEIVSPTLWKEVQDRRARNKELASRNAKREYLLRGVLKCGQCGSTLNGNFPDNEIKRYRCSQRMRKLTGVEQRCSQVAVNGDKLEAAVWGYVLDVITMDPDRFERALLDARERDEAAAAPLRERLAIVDSLLTRHEADMRTHVDLLASATPLLAKTIRESIEALERSYGALVAERDELGATLAKESLTDADVSAALQFRADALAGLEHATFDDKRAMLRRLRVNVVVTGKIAEVTCMIPLEKATIVLHPSVNTRPTGASAWASPPTSPTVSRTAG